MPKLTEDHLEQHVIDLFKKHGFSYVYGPDIAFDGTVPEREASFGDVVLIDRLRQAVARINPGVAEGLREEAIKKVLRLDNQNLIDNNEKFHGYLTNGVEVEEMAGGVRRGKKVWLVDYENIDRNEFVVCNQFTIIENEKNKRPDVILFINGLPLVVLELKNPADENATVHKAFTQLQNYKTAIPSLFEYNTILVASDGLDAKYGSLTADWSRFGEWKTRDGKKEAKKTVPQIETLITGLLNQATLLDIIRHFTVFEKDKKIDEATGLTVVHTIKKIAAYHQYYAVNMAIESTLRATAELEMKLREHPEAYGLPSVKNQPRGDHKAGVVWHTQGSGKSLSMVFYTGKAVLALNNPTVVVITDRNDLDDQLFDTFAGSKQLLRQEPVQAKDRADLKKLLKVASGGIIFTTIQKFSPTDGAETFDLLSDRQNIIVIADEAHRSQYGFSGKITDNKIKYGFAKYLRDALPNASYIGFTGTPIESDDKSTRAVFGNYIDVYDIAQAVTDGATVKIYYESRLAQIHLKDEFKEQLDKEVDEVLESEETTASEKAKTRWTQLEAIVGHRDRIKTVAQDIVEHFSARAEVVAGKAMIVVMSRRIAVDLYDEIIKLKPEWHSADLRAGNIKVVMTSSSSDPENYQPHHTNKEQRKAVADRFKDPSDELKLVIVRDMWLTGFDAPCVKTMYVDKLMRGHNLMQAIARVNRVYKDVVGGLVVDYIGIATDLKKALAVYTESGGKGAPTLDMGDALDLLHEKFEVVCQMFNRFDYKKYFMSAVDAKMRIILEAQEYVLALEDGKNRFTKQVDLLSRAYALVVPHAEAFKIKEDVAFFQAVKARLVKFEPGDGRKSDADIETAIRQIVDKAVVSDGVVDIFEAAGLDKPDISILSDDFLQEVKGMKHKNLAVELLNKLLNDEIRSIKQRNVILSHKLSEMLEKAIKKYHNNLLTAVEVIEELVDLAKEIRKEGERGETLGLSFDEVAFYDALADNGSARDVLGDDTLRDLARILVEKVKQNTSIDWTIRESVRARLRVLVKRLLNQYGYPPDKQKLATENILKQAELFADNNS